MIDNVEKSVVIDGWLDVEKFRDDVMMILFVSKDGNRSVVFGWRVPKQSFR